MVPIDCEDKYNGLSDENEHPVIRLYSILVHAYSWVDSNTNMISSKWDSSGLTLSVADIHTHLLYHNTKRENKMNHECYC